jgi:branched-chain amino acid transport system ATP-binding protein
VKAEIAMPLPLLQAQKLSRHFGGLVAVNEVDFEVQTGEIVGLIGPNGAGKTTLFNMLCASMPPTHGKIIFNGEDCTDLKAHDMAQRGMARTFQITSLFPHLSVFDNVLTGTYRQQKTGWWACIQRQARYRQEEADMAAQTADILNFVGLSDRQDDLAATLPYGDQRKLEIAIALATRPKLLLLDEPAAGMNPDEGAKLVGMIKNIRQRGVTVVLVEHHMKVVMGVCDRVIVIASGQKIAEGAPQHVANHPEVIRVYLGREKVHA